LADVGAMSAFPHQRARSGPLNRHQRCKIFIRIVIHGGGHRPHSKFGRCRKTPPAGPEGPVQARLTGRLWIAEARALCFFMTSLCACCSSRPWMVCSEHHQRRPVYGECQKPYRANLLMILPVGVTPCKSTLMVTAPGEHSPDKSQVAHAGYLTLSSSHERGYFPARAGPRRRLE